MCSPKCSVAMFCACVLALALAAPVFAAMDIRSGHAGHWWSPARSGEGWVLELREQGDAWLYWFTYDGEGGQRWLTAHGQIVADEDGAERIDFPQLVVTGGGRFGNDIDPDQVEYEDAGSATLRFSNCDTASFQFDAFGQVMTLSLQRLAHVMGTRCENAHGVTGREVAAHAGHSGSWYVPEKPGHGFAVHWSTPEQAIVTWYTYDNEGRQMWILGVGEPDGEGNLLVTDAHTTRGARFGSQFDPAQVERLEWGTLKFTLGCEQAGVDYAPLQAFPEGTLDLQRLTRLREVGCPWQAPALETLHELVLEALPVAVADSPQTVHRVRGVELADGGEVWAIVRLVGLDGPLRVARLDPGAESWSLPGDLEPLAPGYGHGLVVRGDRVLVNARDEQGKATVMSWDGNAWAPVPALQGQGALFMTGASADGGFLIGNLLGESDRIEDPWRWEDGAGFVRLSGSVGNQRSIPLCVANDGSRLWGTLLQPRPGLANYRDLVVIWPGGEGDPHMASALGWPLAAVGACADDARVLFMSGAASTPSGLPAQYRHEPWYWRVDNRAGFMGSLLDKPGQRHRVHAASADGNTVVGSYGAYPTFSMGVAEGGPAKAGTPDQLRTDGFIWQPHVGMTPVWSLLERNDLPLPDVHSLEALAVSANGQTVLLQGVPPETTPSVVPGVSLWLLRLTPRPEAAP